MAKKDKKDKKAKKQVTKYGIPELAEAFDMSVGDTRETCSDLVKFVMEMPVGDKLQIPKLGIFEKVIKNPRKARNPRTGETFMTKKKVTIKFRLAANLRDL